MKTKIDPKNFVQSARSLDGKNVLVRAITKSDKDLLFDETEHMSPRSMYYRFFTPKRHLTDKELVYFTDIDYHAHVGLLALVEEEQGFVHAGCGRYFLFSKSDIAAEIAFDVKDEYQGHGIGTILFNCLCTVAKSQGISEFKALVLAENLKMMEVFDHAGLPITKKYLSSGVIEVSMKIDI